MKRAKKPKILNHKIKLAELIKRNCQQINYRRQERGYYWMGSFMVFDKKVYVYFQMYVRRPGVDFVHIKWNDTGRALTVSEIKLLIEKFKNESN